VLVRLLLFLLRKKIFGRFFWGALVFFVSPGLVREPSFFFVLKICVVRIRLGDTTKDLNNNKKESILSWPYFEIVRKPIGSKRCKCSILYVFVCLLFFFFSLQ